MSDRELISVFWATCAAIVLIWGIASMVRLGLDQQERREKLDEITRLGQEIEDDHQTDPEGLCIDRRCMADRPRHSPASVETADQPSASDSPRRGGGSSFQQEQ